VSRLVGVTVLALTLSIPVRAQPSASTGHLVYLDVFATDARGRPVDDLKLSDFELREDGAVQALEDVRFVRDPGTQDAVPSPIQSADAERAAATDGARLFAIFLDEYHVSGGVNTDRARDALLRFVDRELTPRDLVVVMKPLDSILAIRLTADREAVRQSIQSFSGRKEEYDARNAYERNFIAGTPVRIEAARNQVAWSAINALAVHMGGLAAARKTLILVGENLGGPERRRGQEFLATRDTVIRSANRANVAIYSLNPGETAVSSADVDPLRLLAVETDGAVIAGDLDAGLHRIAADSRRYYLLAYRSAGPDDGQFREVEVQAKRPGISLRARKGYVAPSPDDALRASLLARASNPKPAAPAEPPAHVSPLIRPWFGISRGTTGKSRVTFVWEPAGRVPGDRGPSKNPSRLMFTARTADGTVLFEGPVAATGPAAIDEPGATSARAVFDTPPGRLRLRMTIEDATRKVLDVDVRDISIRELKGDVAVGSPEVLRARNAREFRTLVTDDNAVPVAGREFSRTERLLIRFPTYSSVGTPATVSAKLLSRSGQAIRDLTVVPAGEEGEHIIDLSLASLAVGEYVVEVQAATAAGDAKDRVGFRVTP
jgi:VWFA-related protein